METHIIAHGHFYQPPRENPWTGEIAVQLSAHPASNWNERIFSECYQANSASRYLNYYGRVVSINNNYENMSFNFGPTLLNWIREQHPETYQRIVAADALSAQTHGGHGNAIAQAYNHIILPLADEKDKRTQIEWGMADFEAHFHRKTEGMWLAEAAIDVATVDLLIEYGIRFIILSPWQCKSLYNEADRCWETVTDPQSVTGQPYQLLGSKGGSLAVFFYDPALAQAVSFEHCLRDADQFYSLLKEKANARTGCLIHFATDGEIYGHHEPYGDMCFSALTEKIADDPDLMFDNYANYLANHPPTVTAQISLGEDGLGSSWSCCHGVSRWRTDCGCTTGNQPGWNQRWRKPLRDSFDRLNVTLRERFTEKMHALTTTDPETVWNRFIRVLTGEISRSDYAACHSVAPDSVSDFYRLLEARKYSMYMYTSCGWFFAELSGIEPVQNICYALRALELIGGSECSALREAFLTDLSKAQSNLPEKGTGREIALEAEKSFKITKFQSIAQVLAETVAASSLAPPRSRSFFKKGATHQTLNRKVGQYWYESIDYASPDTLKQGTIRFKNWQLLKDYQVDFAFCSNKGGEPYYLFHYKGKEHRLFVSEAKIPIAVRYQYILHLLSEWDSDDETFSDYAVFLHTLQVSGEEMDEETIHFLSDLINLRISKMINERNEAGALTPQYFSTLRNLALSIYFNDENHIQMTLYPYFSDFIYDEVKQVILGEAIRTHAYNALELLDLIYKINLGCNLTQTQGILYQFYQKMKAHSLSFELNEQEKELILKLVLYLNIELADDDKN